MSRTKLTTGIAVAVSLAVVGYFFFLQDQLATPTQASDQSVAAGVESSAGLVAQDEVIGTGAVATTGSVVEVNYVGRLQNGTVFDTSIGKEPLKFTLGDSRIISGWNAGLVGMKVGGKRLLIIPPSMAYGSTQTGPIPPNSTLIFEVQLVSVQPAVVGQ